jgi:hypothetical protein
MPNSMILKFKKADIDAGPDIVAYIPDLSSPLGAVALPGRTDPRTSRSCH